MKNKKDKVFIEPISNFKYKGQQYVIIDRMINQIGKIENLRFRIVKKKDWEKLCKKC